MGKREQLRRLRKEGREQALKETLRSRHQAKIRPYKQLGLVGGLTLIVSTASSLVGWGGNELYFRVSSYLRNRYEVSGPFGTISRQELAEADRWRLKTSRGDIEIQLAVNRAPKTSANFVLLARQGFYDGVKFHRVIKDFMIQTGDPNTKGDDVSTYGTGGPPYSFEDELTGDENYSRAVVAMANSGPDTNGSQFFIVQKDQVGMPKSYTIFAQVTAGMEVVDKIASSRVKDNGQGEKSLPVSPVILEKVEPIT